MTKLIVTLFAVLRARLKRNRTKTTAKTVGVSTYQMTDLGKADLVYTSVTFCALAYWKRADVLGLPSFMEERK